MLFKIIKLEKDIYERKALDMAQALFKRQPEYEAVLFDGINISDLCINDGGQARKCTGREWTKFFYNNLYNPNIL